MTCNRVERPSYGATKKSGLFYSAGDGSKASVFLFRNSCICSVGCVSTIIRSREIRAARWANWAENDELFCIFLDPIEQFTATRVRLT